MTFSTAEPFKSPEGDLVSLTATFSADNKAYAMFTIIAIFRLVSLCRLLAERNEVICSRMLS
jgi:hypothetical protein